EANSNYKELLYEASLLSASSHLIKKGQDSIEIIQWDKDSTGKNKTIIMLDKSLTPGANVSAYYEKYQKAKGTYENAKNEKLHLEEEYEKVKYKFEKALIPTENIDHDIRVLQNLLEKEREPEHVHLGPGLRCTSGGFQILVGRNAKENDELLRHYAKGNDMWLHTRDFPGGYVFIKFRKDKTIPLEVLIDGANLATLFSKGKNNSSVDLYYTQVKYLRRAKDGKTGLVLPTQEKNLTIKPDRKRIERLLPKNESI
ncbi:MAG: DUF814 domain-containing protein, partial [Sphaerochaetaceae bacterium]|nr:DUF814 domain-containing protein [Sphaerochaetaceae bacterium]